MYALYIYDICCSFVYSIRMCYVDVGLPLLQSYESGSGGVRVFHCMYWQSPTLVALNLI